MCLRLSFSRPSPHDRCATRRVRIRGETMTLKSTEPMVVNCVAYNAKGRRERDILIDDISEVLKEPEGFVWVGLHEPNAALLEKLQEEFGLHDLAIEDAHKAHQRPKIEVYGDSLFIVLHTAQLVQGHIKFGETHV